MPDLTRLELYRAMIERVDVRFGKPGPFDTSRLSIVWSGGYVQEGSAAVQATG